MKWFPAACVPSFLAFFVVLVVCIQSFHFRQHDMHCAVGSLRHEWPHGFHIHALSPCAIARIRILVQHFGRWCRPVCDSCGVFPNAWPVLLSQSCNGDKCTMQCNGVVTKLHHVIIFIFLFLHMRIISWHTILDIGRFSKDQCNETGACGA